MIRLYQFFVKLRRDAALDSLRNLFAVLGLGTVIGDFATMRLYYVIPGVALMFAAWYSDYLRHDFSAPREITYEEGNPRLIREIAQLGRMQ